MSGMDGINSLQKMLGALQVNEATNVSGTAAAASKAASTAAAVTGASSSVDRTSLSAAGLASQSADTSDVRLTKVAELRSAILSGTYSVSSSDVADKMVESMLK
jgi:negative regulator of flagellin synthesis FlgM